MNDLDWFIDQVEGLAEQLNLKIYQENEENNVKVSEEEVRTEDHEAHEVGEDVDEEQIKNHRSRGRWDTEEKVTLATGNQSPKQNNDINTRYNRETFLRVHQSI